MHLQKVQIKNYRTCIDSTFELDKELSVLIGPNGSGKTNLLSALRILRTLCTTPEFRNRKSEAPASSATEIKSTFIVGKYRIVHTAKVHVVTNEKNADEIVKSTETWNIPTKDSKRKTIGVSAWQLRNFVSDHHDYGWDNSGERDRFKEWLKEQGLVVKTFDYLSQITEYMLGISYYSASQFTNPGSAPVSFEVEGQANRRTGISIVGHKRILYDIYQEYLNKTETYREFLDLVGSDGINLIESLEFDEIQTSSSTYTVRAGGKVVERTKNNLIVVPRISISGQMLSPSQLSEGTFKTFALVFYLVTDKSSLLMIEEPEVCIHHGLLNSIIEMIKQYSHDKQIVVSTHSDSVLDRIEVKNVRSVKRDPLKGTLVTTLSKNMSAREVKALKAYLSNEGSLGEYWKHGDLE